MWCAETSETYTQYWNDDDDDDGSGGGGGDGDSGGIFWHLAMRQMQMCENFKNRKLEDFAARRTANM